MAEHPIAEEPAPVRPYRQWEWRTLAPLIGVMTLLFVLLVILAVQTYSRFG